MKYHVHVYKVAGLIEVDVDDAPSEHIAREMALQAARLREWKDADCRMFAIIPAEPAPR